MATVQYIGARYVPMFFENSATNDSTWAGNTLYEPLTMVTWNGNTYISKKPVPANVGNPAENPTYWVGIVMTSQQVNQLAEQVAAIQDDLEDVEDRFSETGVLNIANGGTGANSASTALNNLGGMPKGVVVTGSTTANVPTTFTFSRGAKAIFATASAATDYKSMYILNSSASNGAMTKADIVAGGQSLNFSMDTDTVTINTGAATGYVVIMMQGTVTVS